MCVCVCHYSKSELKMEGSPKRMHYALTSLSNASATVFSHMSMHVTNAIVLRAEAL